MTNEERQKASIELEWLEREKNTSAYHIRVGVLRYGGNWPDCTSGGETSKCETFTLFTHRMSRNAVFLAIEEMNLNLEKCLQVKRWKPCGEYYYNAEILTPGRMDKWTMFGGNFIYTSDSRYREVVGIPYPIGVHDRVEE